jgi:hypothetical protein
MDETKIPKARFNPTVRLLESMNVPVAEAVVFLDDASANSEVAKKFVARWRATDKNKRRLNRFDLIAREAGVSPEEVRAVLLRSWRKFQRQTAEARLVTSLPDVADASARAVEIADNSTERMRIMETHELLNPVQKGGGVTVQTAVMTGQSQAPRGLPSFEEQMRLADSKPKELPEHVDAEFEEVR